MRMMRDMQRIGEAAGIAAAMAVKLGITPRQLDVAQLQAELRRVGALDVTQRPAPALPEPEAPTLKEKLVAEKPQEAVWSLVQSGQTTLPAVRDALQSNVPAARFWASVVLAMQRQRESLPELMTCVRERRAAVSQGEKAAPHWEGAIVLMGRVGDRAAVPVLTEVLRDRSTRMDALIATVRALGRIGDRAAVPVIEEALQRTDIDTTRHFQVSSGAATGVTDNAAWQWRLAAAEALAKLGKSRPDIVEPFLEDERAYVRRYAARVMEMSK
jgi:HEAT repeat protein